MGAREIEAKSVLRRFKKIDSWFVASAGMNLYRGCGHDCAYCDGRAEKYRVEGEFAREVSAKVNALEVLAGELGRKSEEAPSTPELWPEIPLPGGPAARDSAGGARRGLPRRRGNPPSGFILVGGGVGDSYQPLEEEYRLSRGALELLYERNLPVHVLTKSTLVLRDVDVLARINRGARAVVSFSISSVDDEASAVFEPGVPPPSERLKALSVLKSAGLVCGIYLLPVIPFVSDSGAAIESSVRAAKEAGADFVAFGGMTLKEGRQKEHFMRVISRARPEAAEECRRLYANHDPWGNAAGDYYERIGSLFASAARKHGTPPRMPLPVFRNLLQGKDLAIVLLEHIHEMLRLEGKRSRFGWAAYQVSKAKGPLAGTRGVDSAAARAIREILETGTSTLYEELLAGISRP